MTFYGRTKGEIIKTNLNRHREGSRIVLKSTFYVLTVAETKKSSDLHNKREKKWWKRHGLSKMNKKKKKS